MWVLRAALALGSKGPLDVAVDGHPSAGKPRVDAALPLGQGRAVRIENRGTAPAFVSLATTGVPSGPQPAEANGFTVRAATTASTARRSTSPTCTRTTSSWW